MGKLECGRHYQEGRDNRIDVRWIVYRQCELPDAIGCLSPHLPHQIVGPQLYFSREAPTYRTGLYCDIAAWSLLCVLCVAMGFHLRHLNNKQAKRRMALGLSIDIQDMSIMSLEEASAYRLALTQQLRQHGFDEAKLYEHSFDDMTDFE